MQPIRVKPELDRHAASPPRLRELALIVEPPVAAVLHLHPTALTGPVRSLLRFAFAVIPITKMASA